MDVHYGSTFDLLIHINLTDIIYVCKGSLLIVKYVMIYFDVTRLPIYIYIRERPFNLKGGGGGGGGGVWFFSKKIF